MLARPTKHSILEEKRNIDFKRHTSPPVSKRYVLRIAFYIILLTVLGIILYALRSKEPEKLEAIEIQEINGVTIELPEVTP